MKCIYLDYCATSPIAPEVQECIVEMLPHFGNPSSEHPFGWFVAEKIQIAREQVAQAINARPEEIIFTSGATESNNLALQGVVRPRLAKGVSDTHLISAPTEHRAILDPLTALQAQGTRASLLSVDNEGHIDLSELEHLLEKGATLVTLMLANNEIGTIHPIVEVAKHCAQYGALLHCDATQGLGRLRLDVQELGVDMLSLSAHKCYGPKGVGALYVKRGTPISEILHGGGHEAELRSGTLNTLGIVAFGCAARLAANQQTEDSQRIQTLTGTLAQLLEDSLGEIHYNGSSSETLPGLLALSIPGVQNTRLLSKLQTKVAFSLSSACQSASKTPSHVLSALGLKRSRVDSAIRLSLGRYTTAEELDEAHTHICKAVLALR